MDFEKVRQMSAINVLPNGCFQFNRIEKYNVNTFNVMTVLLQ